MRHFVGLDVSHRTTAISIINERGDRVKDQTVSIDAGAIAGALKNYRRTCGLCSSKPVPP